MASSSVLIESVSGIRGIIGRGFDPGVIVRYGMAFGAWCREQAEALDREPLVVVGRDARPSGAAFQRILMGTLQSMGCDVLDAGLAPTPTVEMGVLQHNAAGGVILSASHNPLDWNALKLLDHNGEFLDAEAGAAMKKRSQGDAAAVVSHDKMGTYTQADLVPAHIEAIRALSYIDPASIAARDLTIVVDGCNSVGGVALPLLLQELGVRDTQIVRLFCTPNGQFERPPEPRPDHLTALAEAVTRHNADLGLAVDPDADRLALVDNKGRIILEELTQVLAADFLWRRREGAFATNLSSSRAIDDVAVQYNQPVHRSAVGEINVVQAMKAHNAILGGEGNGGVILPELHYGRDALAGTALIVQHLASTGSTLAELHDAMPTYAMAKDKLPLDGLDVDALLATLESAYAGVSNASLDTTDGLKIDLPEGWVHLRASNTEPILRVYTEAPTQDDAQALADRFKKELQALNT
ncbi:phosphoglucosamine mutase [Longimonas halophila]|uniref:Phosphoglucosamine mutase n=1 Tax=Longimonas halophila TaxID=1469170 RepID=A0A2H3NMI2_9BACT|nr:phosphoglucosamine mutase [Longimonas halophila]PEN07659.1 phosphoglucosamine mutase [Longimonas halophila]